MSQKNNPDTATQSLAERRLALEELLATLESGEVPIEAVADRLEEAAALAASIERDLDEQKASIEVLKERFDRDAS